MTPPAARRAQGACSSAPSFPFLPAGSLLPLRAGQCVLVLASPLLVDQLDSRGQLWIHNIYARIERTTDQVETDDGVADNFFNIVALGGDGTRSAWLTGVTLQSNRGFARGLSIFRADALVNGACPARH